MTKLKMLSKPLGWKRYLIKNLVTTVARSFGYCIYIGREPPSNSLGEHLNDLFSRLEINCVFDVGAHFGEYGLFLRSIGYKGHIISFEPVAANFSVLEQQCADDPKWSAHHLALGDQEGSSPINVTHATNLSSFLAPIDGLDELKRAIEVERVEMVEVKRLDSIFSECIDHIKDPRVYLKTDVQGCDLQVLEGAGAYLNVILALQSEVIVKPLYKNEAGYIESIARMSQMGFELTGLFPVNRDKDLRIIALDCVMIRRGKP